MAAKLSTQVYKGSRDFYPEDMRLREWMFARISTVLESFGFEKIDSSLIEPIEVYLAKTSEEIVNQQIYSFIDRGDRKVAIRPEMTPTVARMVSGRLRELTKPVRWYSIPNLWRYERPGKGRLREHWQLNADILSARDEFLADLEIIQLAAELMFSFGANKNDFKIYISHRGILNNVLGNVLKLPANQWANISRIIDKIEKISKDEFNSLLKNESFEDSQINSLMNYLHTDLDFIQSQHDKIGESASYLLKLMQMLKELGLSDVVVYKPSIVRGFDYYTGVVFEVFDTHEENRRSLFGGGRYNNLAGAFTNETVNAAGFGMGDVTFTEFLTLHNLLPDLKRKTQIYIAGFGNENEIKNIFSLASRLREQGFIVELSSGDAKIKKQFEEANAKQIPVVLLQGEDELKLNAIQIKLMESGEQITVPLQHLESELRTILNC